jgi:hypothetical protein
MKYILTNPPKMNSKLFSRTQTKMSEVLDFNLEFNFEVQILKV